MIFTLFVMITSLTLVAFDNTTAAYFYDVDLSCDETYKETNRQNPAFFYILLKNTGENHDIYTVDLAYTDEKETWSVSFVKTGTKSLEVYVPSGRSVYVNATIKPDCSCEEGNTLSVNVRAYSNSDSGSLDNITIQATYKIDYDPGTNGNDDKPDTDGDGWSDEDEAYFGNDPFDPNDYPEMDTDGDGLSDDFETNYGTDPKTFDTDHDGDTDFEEYEGGTDPLDPNDNSKTKSNNGADTDSESKSSGNGPFGLGGDDGLFLILIPILIVIVVVSVVILLYVWRSEPPKDDSKSFEKLEEKYNGRVEDDPEDSEDGKLKSSRAAATPSSRIETLDVKPEKTPDGYKCPECGREFKTKSLKKHLLRTHHKRIKAL